MTDNSKIPASGPYADTMLGFWPQLLVVLVALYFAGLVFAETALGRWLLLIPVLMSFVPFGWHLQQTVTLLGADYPQVVTRFLALAVGLGLILLVIAVAWIWRYIFSVFVFPLLSLLVYYFGPWLYLKNNSPEATLPATDTLSLFAALASLCLLAYTLPYIRQWLRSNV
jgi:hypothetical protein